MPPEPSIYDQVGGEPVFTAIVNAFYDGVATDEVLRPLYPNDPVESLISAGGSIILTSSTAGVKGIAYTLHYTAAKHGVVGIMRTLTQEVSGRFIRVNTIHPGIVNTPMIHNEATYRLFRPDLENPTFDDFVGPATTLNLMPIAQVEAEDVSNAVLFLASDESRYVTGAILPVDGGASVK